MPEIRGYRLLRVIGHGGMSTVYLAEQESLGRKVAVKVMLPEALADEVSRRRFENEARTIARLDHPNIVGIYEVGRTTESLPYYAMPYLARGHLGLRITKQGGRTRDQARVIATLRALLGALDYAHVRGVVHRDVKAENVLFDEADRPLLADFGIALRKGINPRVTMAGLAVGSTAYMPPEQARGEEVDSRADLYSIGVLAWEMLTGDLPFMAGDALSMAVMHAQDPIPRLPLELRHWQRFIDKALAKSPANRYRSAQQMLEALDRVERGGFSPDALIGTGAALWQRARTLPMGAWIGDRPGRRRAGRLRPAPGRWRRRRQSFLQRRRRAGRRVPGDHQQRRGDGIDDASAAGVAGATLDHRRRTATRRAQPDRTGKRQRLRQRARRLACGRGPRAHGRDDRRRGRRTRRRDGPPPAQRRRRTRARLPRPRDHAGGTDRAAGHLSARQPAGSRRRRRCRRASRPTRKASTARTRWPRPRSPANSPATRRWPANCANAPGKSRRTGQKVAGDRAGATVMRGSDGPFAAMRREVTRAEYARFASATNRAPALCREKLSVLRIVKPRDWRAPGFAQDDGQSVVCVSWADATAYAQWFSRNSGQRYRLPSAAEWQAIQRNSSTSGRAVAEWLRERSIAGTSWRGSATRTLDPDRGYDDVGFRLVREL